MPEPFGHSGGHPEREALARGLAVLEVPAEPESMDRLLEFAAQVRKWNASYNLVGRGDLDVLISRHILDSLAILRYLAPGSLLDAGSGAGFPGMPLAIIRPDLEITLLDSAGKKARFMRHVKRTLGLANVQVVHGRLETLEPQAPFGNIVCRAFASLRDFVSGMRRSAGPQTRILAMKGRMPEKELGDLPGWVEVERVVPLEVPDLHAERHLVIMCLSPEARMSNDI